MRGVVSVLSSTVEMENLDKVRCVSKSNPLFLRISLCWSTSPSSPFFSFFLTALSLLLALGLS